MAQQNRPRPSLTLERLEDRCTPVVGATAVPGPLTPAMATYDMYSGVVQIVANSAPNDFTRAVPDNDTRSSGTGALFLDGFLR